MPEKARRLIITIAVLIFIFFGFLLFGGGPSTKTPKENVKDSSIDLTSYVDKDSQVQLTTDGQIVSDEKHRAIRINVSASEVVADVIAGYQGNVIDSRRFTNNQDAYRNFLFSLSRAGFARSRKTNLADDRGVCPLGQRYFFQLYSEGKQEQQLWYSSCGYGNAGGNIDTLRTLFRRQVPNYDSMTSAVQL